MDTSPQDFENLENLLLTKEYDALTDKEKELFFPGVNSKNCEKMRQHLQNIKRIIHDDCPDLEPDISIQHKLAAIIEQKGKPKETFRKNSFLDIFFQLFSFKESAIISGGFAVALIAFSITTFHNRSNDLKQPIANDTTSEVTHTMHSPVFDSCDLKMDSLRP